MTSIQTLAGRLSTATGRAAAVLGGITFLAIERVPAVAVEALLALGLGVALVSIAALYLWLALETARLVKSGETATSE